MGQFFEALMLISFGVSWPIDIKKGLKSRTAKGKSIIFLFCIFVGYIFGISAKFVSGNITYVLFFYILNFIMVSMDIVLSLRNRKLDILAEKNQQS